VISGGSRINFWEENQEEKLKTGFLTFKLLRFFPFKDQIHSSFKSSNFSTDGIQPSKPVKVILKAEKNRDGKTGKATLYFNYPRSRILTNEEYMSEFGEVMKI